MVRHGETRYNALGILQGSLDSPLTALGRRQALAVAATLRSRGAKPVLALTSPQGRARETMELIRGELPSLADADALVTPCLAEMDYGAYQGLPIDLLPFDPWAPRDAAKRAGGETGAEVAERVLGGIAHLAGDARGDVLAVSHGTVMSHLIEAIGGGGAPRTDRLAIENGRILVLEYDPVSNRLSLIETLTAELP